MAYKVKSLDELRQDLTSKQQELAVVKSKVSELSEKLGIEPTIEVIEEKIASLRQESEKVESQIEEKLKALEELDKQYQEIKKFNEPAVPQKESKVQDDFE